MTNPDVESDTSSDGLSKTAYPDSFGDLCAAFQDAIQKGLSPDIGQIVESAQCDNKEGLFRELLKIETRSRSEEGKPSARAEYLERFPEFEAQIESVLGERATEKTRLIGSSESPNPETPDSIGRFKVVRLLGIGGFGRVYQARDPKLKRDVAIKVMRAGLSRGDEALKEAQNAAQLNHEGIVRIYDVDTDAAEPYIVQEYVSGESLADRLQKGQTFSIAEAIQLMIHVADALGFAHRHRLFHRDLKPGNILVEQSGMPRLIDFGLAIHEEDREQHRGEIAGSMGYMAPEQFRGESHRVDDRTDIWSLCVIFYRLLTGRLPFGGSSGGLIAEEVQFVDHVPMRQLDANIPAALDRIVGKGLAKRMVDRYALCSELIEELEIVRDASGGGDVLSQGQPQAALQSLATSHESSSIPELSGSFSEDNLLVVPRGLSSFSEADAKFYPSLLPGPFDRDGLPTSISFWLDRIANIDPTKAVPIGVVYGRSGCGKSSLVRAGVLPRVSRNVIPVYADCTDRGTEQRIIEAVDASFGESTGDMDILRRFVAIRESSRRKRNPKVLIILDQFEQWLHGRTNIAQERLTMALRQCDGVSLQVLIVVRDDFWLAVSQFLRAIEVPIAEDQNTMAVELFGNRHARDVLKRFGMAYGAIPKTVEEQTDDHNRFLDVAISDLSDGSHVPCVTLSLFAHMFKGQDWTGAALSSMGGTDAVGVQYLERVFDRDAGPLLLRRYGQHARRILDCLLPNHGSDIKGYTKTREELKQATELEDAQLDELLRLLDKELSLVGVSDSGESSGTPARNYQLAHDYMVAPIRKWSTLSRRRTAAGRAQLDLREAAGRWNAQRIPDLLPSIGNYARFRYLVPRAVRSPLEEEFLAAWGRRNYVRIGIGLFLVAALLVGARNYALRLRAQGEARAKIDELAQVQDDQSFDEVVASLENPVATNELEATLHVDGAYRRRSWLALRLSAEDALTKDGLSNALDMLPECDALEGRKLVRLLSRSKDDAIAAANRRIELGDEPDATADYAAALVLLGDTSVATRLVHPSQDPTYRSVMTKRMGEWCTAWGEHAKLITSDLPESLRSAIADSITLGWKRVDLRARASVLEFLTSIVETSQSLPATVVSSVTHILESNNGQVIRQNNEYLPNKDWFVSRAGIRFLRLGPRDTSPFPGVFLADRELTNRLMFEYINDPDAEKVELKPLRVELGATSIRDLDDAPADMISLDQAAALCNWLSKREGLTPCFTHTESGWRMDPDQSGYRVPTLEELDYAARGTAGTAYEWHCMGTVNEELFSLYETIKQPRGMRGVTQPLIPVTVASRLPNSLGFYDTLGCVSEWVWTEGDKEGWFRVYGGSMRSRTAQDAIKIEQWMRDEARGVLGFRLAIKKGKQP